MTVSAATVPGEILTSAYLNNNINSGLTFISATTIGNAVSSHTVSGCFSSTYDNYKVVINGGVSSGPTDWGLQLSGITTSVYQTAGYFMNFGTATVNAFGAALATTWLMGTMSTTRYASEFDLISPNLAQQKFFVNSTGIATTGFYSFNGVCTSTAAATGFVITPNAGTITGGTVTVYGYRKA
jgi:hypothetical protein